MAKGKIHFDTLTDALGGKFKFENVMSELKIDMLIKLQIRMSSGQPHRGEGDKIKTYANAVPVNLYVR